MTLTRKSKSMCHAWLAFIALYFSYEAIASQVTLSPNDPVASLNRENSGSPIITSAYATLDNHTLHYVTAGTGKLMLFYHGFPSFWYMWKHQISALSKHYRVVAVDGLGANLSDRPSSLASYHISRLATDLNQLALQLAGDQPFILVGHDWGGALAWAFAQQYPERVDKLIVLSAPPYNLFLKLLQSNRDQQQASRYVEYLKSAEGEKQLGTDDTLWHRAYGKLIEQSALSISDGQYFRQALARPGAITGGINWYRANIPAPDAITNDNFWPAYNARTSVKSLLIWGEEDRTFVPEFIKHLPQYADKITVKTLPGVHHWPPLTVPEQVNQLILNFVRAP